MRLTVYSNGFNFERSSVFRTRGGSKTLVTPQESPMPSTALVHEWLVRWGGSESVLASLSSILPRAPIYTLLHHPDERVKASFGGRDVIATPLSRIPGAGSIYPAMLPLMPEVWRRTRVPASEFIVSSSHAFCKSIDAGNAIHVCYCHTPPRYIWDLVDEYQPASVRRLSAPLLQHLRRRDLEAAQRVDHFVANSRFVAARIRRLYGRESRVVYPPVDVDRFVPEDRPRTHFLAGGRLVRYKRIDRAIEAANEAALPLVVFGDGPDSSRLRSIAGPTVHFVGACDDRKLLRLMQGAIALIFPGVEDFGILPVETQAAGTPVVALAEGGALETVVDGATGLLYEEDSVTCLLEAMRVAQGRDWNTTACRANAGRFSRARFEEEMLEVLRSLGFTGPP